MAIAHYVTPWPLCLFEEKGPSDDTAVVYSAGPWAAWITDMDGTTETGLIYEYTGGR